MLEVNGRPIKLQIWDTAGQERFRSICRSFYRGAHAIVFVYDQTKPHTFDKFSQCLEDFDLVNASCQPVHKVVLANKADMEQTQQDQARNEEIFKLLDQEGIEHYSCSAKTNLNINEA